MFKTGDQVSVIDDLLTGTVISITPQKAVIEDEHGFTYDFLPEQLVLRDAALYDRKTVTPKAETLRPTSKKHSRQPFRLDLHFENLVSDPGRYSAAERLFIQKEKLRATLDYCRLNRLKKLNIIHGIGQGVLQNLVLEVLDSQTDLDYHHAEILAEQSGTVHVFFK